MRRTIILAAALGIIVLGLWGTAVIYFDESRLKGIISDRLSEQVGRRVEIVGALEFSLFPRPRLEAREVVIGASGNEDGRAVFRAARVSMSLRLIALLRGDLAPGRIQLELGVYDPETMRRLPVVRDGATIADRVLLAPLEREDG
jgi:uncharacterized protein involved in outer membrane biogenesis